MNRILLAALDLVGVARWANFASYVVLRGDENMELTHLWPVSGRPSSSSLASCPHPMRLGLNSLPQATQARVMTTTPLPRSLGRRIGQQPRLNPFRRHSPRPSGC